jgi:preprotein translocase subunit SecF
MFQFIEKHWKILPFIPLSFLVISLGILASNYITTGFFIGRDIELTGGNQITVSLVGELDLDKIQTALPYARVHQTTGITKSLLIETSSDVDVQKVLNDLSAIGVSGETSVKTVGPVLGGIFWSQAQMAIILAFVFMAIVVFILFRAPVPSSIVVLCAATDIIITVGAMSVLGINLSLATLAALLMLIGYSVDTDIVLTTELLKRKEREIPESIKIAMKTGLTMSMTTLGALVALYMIGTYVLEQIAMVLIIGITVDIFATWFTNAGILRLWLFRKRGN